MANENVFSTPKETKPSASETLEAIAQRRAVQARNRMALAESKALEKSLKDADEAMEAAALQARKEVQQVNALEQLAHQQGSKNIARGQIGMRQRIVAEGTDYVNKKVLEELVYEAYWLDDAVKESADVVASITDTIGSVVNHLEDNFKDSKVAESDYSPLLKNVKIVIDQVVQKAADRIYKAAMECGDVDPEFELNEEEENELDDKLSDLGKDEIVELIKDKVATVVQDEKEKGQERSEMFKAIDSMVNGTGDGEAATTDDANDGGEESSEEGDGDTSSEEETAEESAMIDGITKGEVVTEGANWDTLKIYFSGLRKRASKYCKEGNTLYKQGKYADAAKKFEQCKDIFEDVKKRLVDVEDDIPSVIISFFLSYFTPFIAFVDAINTRGGAANVDMFNAYKDTNSWNYTRQITIGNCNKMINYCDVMIRQCKDHEKEEKTGKAKEYKYSLEAALKAVSESNYSSGERYFSTLLENGQELHLVAEDPTWNDFKVCISMLSKKARDLILKAQGGDTVCYGLALTVIDELMKQIATTGENVPVDVKQFVLASVSTIFAPIPSDEIIISRFGVSLGSPETSSVVPEINWETTAWVDIEANIKTNLMSTRDWCSNKAEGCKVIDSENVNSSECPVSGKDSLAQVIAKKQNQIINKNIGGSLFEALMMNALQRTTKSCMESGINASDEDIEDAALTEALLYYTIFETLDTVGLYKFRMRDMDTIQRSLVRAVREGESPFENGVMQSDKDAKGLKKIRINTQKMKRKSKSTQIGGEVDMSNNIGGKSDS